MHLADDAGKRQKSAKGNPLGPVPTALIGIWAPNGVAITTGLSSGMWLRKSRL